LLKGDHGRDDIGLVTGLPVGGQAEALEHRSGHLALPAAHPGDVRRQAVQVQRFPRAGHQALGALPVGETPVVLQALLLQLLQT
jgi:hypothetical protein